MLLLLELLGGVGLFLLGMSMLTDGLKLAAGDGLRAILRDWTRTPLRGLASGALVTGLVQSSSAVTVAIIGFVNAGLLTLRHAVWVIFGANIGTTMTAWLVVLVGLKLDIGAFALPMTGAGVLLRLFASSRPRLSGSGTALAGFGLFFLGIGTLKSAFETLIPFVNDINLAGAGLFAPAAFLLAGIVLSTFAQSSSAAIALILTATASGGLPLELAGAGIIGANVGTSTTAIFASFGATPAARRVALAHIVFNLYAGTAAFVLLYPLMGISYSLADAALADSNDAPLTLAVFNSLLNVFGVILVWPFVGRLLTWLQSLYQDDGELTERPMYLDPTLAAVPAVALRGLVLEIQRMMQTTFDLAGGRVSAAPGHVIEGGKDANILALGQAIRDFIAELSRQPLPAEVVDALPDLIRSIHHVEEALAEGRSLHDLPHPPIDLVSGASWDRLKAGVLAALETEPEDPEAFKTEFDLELKEVEAAYEAIKKDLLASIASGRSSVEPMEAALLRARRMRRIAEAALKAERRLCPWAPIGRDRVDSGTPVSSPA